MVKITLEGDPEELEAFLKRLGRQGFPDEFQDAEQGGRREGSVGEKPSLSQDEIFQLLSVVRQESIRIIQEIARRPTGYSFDELQKAVRLSGLAVAGRLSSIGHQLHKLFPGRADPIIRDYSQNVYRMLPEVAEAVRNFGQSQQ